MLLTTKEAASIIEASPYSRREFPCEGGLPWRASAFPRKGVNLVAIGIGNAARKKMLIINMEALAVR
jgi:hypothetical protein